MAKRWSSRKRPRRSWTHQEQKKYDADRREVEQAWNHAEAISETAGYAYVDRYGNCHKSKYKTMVEDVVKEYLDENVGVLKRLE